MKFQKFKNRNFRFRGDRNTWIGWKDENTIVVNVGKGIITEEYWEEFLHFLSQYNIRIDKDIRCGERKEFVVNLTKGVKNEPRV